MATIKHNPVSHGIYTSLASDYSRYRPAYSERVLDAVLALCNQLPETISFADIGAGTGIWTRMVARRNVRVTAVEPNDEMRRHGENDSKELMISWQKGTAETTGLLSGQFDIVSMASSFHWTDFGKAIQEFHRILRPGGCFVALWNPRLIETSPLLVEIEETLKQMVPNLRRVSSGRSEFCDSLRERLESSGYFTNMLYLEGVHVERMSPERYLGAWRSVNDIQAQAGPERFDEFLAFVARKIAGMPYIDATYSTRAWHVKRKDDV